MAYSVVLSTVGSLRDAKKIAKKLVARKCAACVSIVPGIQSFYWWKGKIDFSGEYLLVMKTQATLYRKLEKELRRLHPYEVPEILSLPIRRGSRRYLDWLESSLR